MNSLSHNKNIIIENYNHNSNPDTHGNKSVTVHATSEVPPPRGHHPLGRALPRNIAKSMKERTDSSLPRYASSGVEHNSRKYYELLDKSQETETAEVHSPDNHMNESSGAYDLGPPSLTNSEYESESDLDPDVTEGAYLNRLPNTAPEITDYTETNGSGKVNLENKNGPDIMNKNVNINGESYIQSSNPDTHMNKSVTVCAKSEVTHTVGHHPLGRASSRNMGKDIRRGTESSPFRPASACATAEASLSLGHHPLGRATSDRKRSPEELHGSLDRDCERDAVKTEESSYSSSVGVPNLNKVVRRTRYSHADNSAETTTNIAYITETELGKTNPEGGSITPTATKKRTKIAKDPDIMADKKFKVEHTMSKKIQANNFQPLGTALSRVTTVYENGTTNYKNGTLSSLPKYTSTRMEFNPGTSYELLSKIQETAAAEDYTPDSSMRKTIKARNLTLPDLVESGDETDSDSDPESDQEYGIKRAMRQPGSAPNISECEFHGPKGKNLKGNIFSESVTRGENTSSKKLHPDLELRPKDSACHLRKGTIGCSPSFRNIII